MNEPYVNRALMERVLEIKQRSENNRLVLDTIDTTKMWNMAIHMPDEELIVCTLAALYKCPDMVFTAIATDRAELLRKGKRNEQQNQGDFGNKEDSSYRTYPIRQELSE